MAWLQREIVLEPHPRGVHLITRTILRTLPELASYRIGLLHLFIKHTSASLAVNESYDPEVRDDIEMHLNQMIPENAPYYTHTYEGADDMPSHIKSLLIGSSLTLPITDGSLNLGTWQGIYLCEHRNRGGGRRIVATLQGE